tara:strand:+ start:1297 stop:1767 length:471 start_codon:yes stop_codon:yes gene_type:complete
MQTFLPYPSFKESAKVLDWRRLGKQRVEGMQIINAISGVPRKDGKPYKGWTNHPCSVMWKPYLPALKLYTNIIIKEWEDRGYNNNMKYYDVEDIVIPHWIGNERIHSSHRANLLRKDYEYYSKFGWTENSEDPYVWHDVEGKFYEQHVGTGQRIYL